MSDATYDLGDGFTLVDESRPTSRGESDEWRLRDADGHAVGSVSVYVTGYKYPSVNTISMHGARGRGLGRRAVKKLVEHYGALSSDPQGNTSDVAVAMWRALGARRVDTDKNVKGYHYLLEVP